ncbi:MAG TPA: SDR family oxidoreductase [Candidatus Acidoferrales bacterium]|nr:SDR family oxidoreductase [Candidatus Acidoferrales bacterium]
MQTRETQPPQQHRERQPGRQDEMRPEPQTIHETWKPSDLLKGKAVIVTGGDSGIGRAVAVACAREGADVAIVYLEEHEDAHETQRLVEAERRTFVAIAGDAGDENFCREAVQTAVAKLGRLDILVNASGEQHRQARIEDITAEQLERTFRTNIFSFFYMTKAALPHMKEGGAIVNTASVTAYKGNGMLIDYASTKGAIVSFTRSLSAALADRKIRVNAVAPGPIWTPLIPATFDEKAVAEFGRDVPLKRPGQPAEVAPAFVFLASDLSSYITGQTLHVNGGTIVNG